MALEERVSATFAQLLVDVGNLSRIAIALAALQDELPAGPFKDQFELCRLEIVDGIDEVKTRANCMAAPGRSPIVVLDY